MFILYRDKKKALMTTVVLGLLLAVMSAVLLPGLASKANTSGFKSVKAQVFQVHEGAGDADPSWVEYRYSYKDQTYIARFEEPVRSRREGRTVILYANVKQPDQVVKNPPPGSNQTLLTWLVISPVALLFAVALTNCILVFRKEEKQDADS